VEKDSFKKVIKISKERKELAVSISKYSYKKYLFSLVFLLIFLIGRPVEFGQEKSFFHGYALQRPVIRVAIGRRLDEALIRASSGMKVYEVSDRYQLVSAESYEILFRGSKIQLSEKFLVQVGQAESRREAEKLAKQLNSKIGGRLIIAEEIDRYRGRRLYALRYGDFLTRGEALAFIKKLNEAGISEAWIWREEVARLEKNAFWALIDNQLLQFKDKTTLYLIPVSQGSFLSYNGTAYRGMFIVQMTSSGLQIINVLNLEDYLKGVVPAELSPDRFGNLEALKAQAVAARTYAFRNLGLMASEGFDLLATPEHQAYGGLGAEHPLSNRAVEETRGEGLFYRGKPIEALYTSTCGGMTEDGRAMFGGSDLAYLKATPCVEEKMTEYELKTAQPARHFLLGTRDITQEITLLASLGIIDPGNFSDAPATYLNDHLRSGEIVNWMKALIDFLKIRPHPVNPPAEPLIPATFARYVIDCLDWTERMQHLLLQSEVNFLLGDFPSGQEKDRRPVAYLIREGYFPLPSERSHLSKPISRAEALLTLARIIQKEKNPLRKARFRKFDGNNLELEANGETQTFRFSPQAFLFRSLDGQVFPAASLLFLGGEEVTFMERDHQILWLRAEPQPLTNVLDRSSPFSSWQVRWGREELSRRLNESFPVGELKDLRILKRGESHRVIELEIVGESGRAVVRGLRVRWLLGLRDTLFTIDRELDAEGHISHFIFTGRGWGHGVGLCQVGAYGLAQRGATYRQILNKYYPGTKIGKLY